MSDEPKPQYDKEHTWTNEFKDVVSKYAPKDMKAILEWGAGTSTVGFCKFGEQAGSDLFVTIDHHGDYLQSVINDRIGEVPSFLRPHEVPLSETKSPRSFRNKHFYSSAPLHYRRAFDAIFVDGRVRNECLFMAALLARPNAFIMLHDFRRIRYVTSKFLFEVVDSDYRGSLVLKRKPAFEAICSGFVDSLPEARSIAILDEADDYAEDGRNDYADLGKGGDLDEAGQDALQALLDKYLTKDLGKILEWGTRVSTGLIFEHVKNFHLEHYLSVKPSVSSMSGRTSPSDRNHSFDERPVSVIGHTKPGGRDLNFHYSTCPVFFRRLYDFIYVGRERRNECLLTAALLSHPETIVILQNSDHVHYTSGRFLFETVEKAGGFAVLRRKPELTDVFGDFLESLGGKYDTAEIDSAR